MIAACRHCQQPLTQTGPPIVGQTTEQKIAEFAEKVITPHMQAHHPEALLDAMLLTGHLATLSVLCQVQTGDTLLCAARTMLAAAVCRATSRAMTPADMHKAVPAKASFTRAEVLAIVRQLYEWLSYGDILQAAPLGQEGEPPA
jgi:hypothetical protein